MPSGFHCQTCGQYHDHVPMSFGAEGPVYYLAMSEQERSERCEHSTDLCVIDQQHYFIRGRLELPIMGSDKAFIWGVWCSLSEESFKQTILRWDATGREQDDPMFGWLSTKLPAYPETLNLKTIVHPQPPGDRPLVILEETDHPLSIEQREGITMDRVQEIAEAVLHG